MCAANMKQEKLCLAVWQLRNEHFFFFPSTTRKNVKSTYPNRRWILWLLSYSWQSSEQTESNDTSLSGMLNTMHQSSTQSCIRAEKYLLHYHHHHHCVTPICTLHHPQYSTPWENHKTKETFWRVRETLT